MHPTGWRFTVLLQAVHPTVESSGHPANQVQTLMHCRLGSAIKGVLEGVEVAGLAAGAGAAAATLTGGQAAAVGFVRWLVVGGGSHGWQRGTFTIARGAERWKGEVARPVDTGVMGRMIGPPPDGRGRDAIPAIRSAGPAGTGGDACASCQSAPVPLPH